MYNKNINKFLIFFSFNRNNPFSIFIKNILSVLKKYRFYEFLKYIGIKFSKIDIKLNFK